MAWRLVKHKENFTFTFFTFNRKGRDYSEDVGVDGKIILE